MSTITHICGGTIITGGSDAQSHLCCDRCGAFRYAAVVVWADEDCGEDFAGTGRIDVAGDMVNDGTAMTHEALGRLAREMNAEPLPDGTDRYANREAWDAGENESPDAV